MLPPSGTLAESPRAGKFGPGASEKASGLAVAEEMAVDELVDGALVRWLDALELQAHSHSPVGPRDPRLGIDVALRAGKPQPDPEFRAGLERAGRPDRH